MNYEFKIEGVQINKGLSFQYFHQIKDNYQLLGQAFDLSKKFKEPIVVKDSEDRKEYLIVGEENQSRYRLTFWKDLQPHINRNYSGLMLDIGQTVNADIPEIIKIYFSHHNSHAIGQVDLTVDQCTLISTRIPTSKEIKALELNLRTFLMLLEAV
ncbi:MAG: hypothetical protein MK078_15980 [Crocinitomicaceae bacterium]|nr:hypothetical protein [Crocinitomicaceae bacterium]